MNVLDKLRIKRNPNVIDFFDANKLGQDRIHYAIQCGYQFNPETMGKFIKNSNYVQTFKKEDELFQYIKQLVINSSEDCNIELFYKIYSDNGMNIDEFVIAVRTDDEISKLVIENSENFFGLKMNNIIQIIDGKDELIDEMMQKFSSSEIYYSTESEEFAEYIAAIKSPKELADKEIKNPYFDKAFINLADPEKILELFRNFEQKDFSRNERDFVQMIEDNIEQFIPYLERLDEIYETQMKRSFINPEIRDKTINYLKENNILYNEKVPKFALKDDEYVLQCIEQDPTIISVMGNLENFHLEKYEEKVNKIAQKIANEEIRFEGVIPYQYQCQKEIFDSIVTVNSELLENSENRIYLRYHTREMSDEEVVTYYEEIQVPFNAETAREDNFLLILKCLKNDYSTLSDTRKEFTQEEYKEIYEVIKDEIKPEEVLENRFLLQNPYFVNDLLKSEVDLSEVNLEETKYYEHFYPELKSIAIKNGVSIPKPKDYKGIIKFNDKDEVYVNLDSLENIRKGLEYIEKQELGQELTVELRQEKFDEFVISDNIEFFEELAQNNININFEYNTGNYKFSLEEVLEDEHFMQQMAEDIKSRHFSPLEQLVAVYDIAKAFKPYKEGIDAADSRALYEYLGNNYIVCAGYADLIANLGHRLNAPYSKIYLDVVGNENSGHARNYANIVDKKYEVNGYYVMDATWEQNGKAGRNRLPEAYRSTYNEFLLTTEEGRNNADLGEKIRVENYDNFFTSETPEELRKGHFYHFQDMFKRMTEQVKVLDPEFYKTMDKLNLSKDEDANVILEYFKSKVNKPVSKEVLLDAIMEVKKSIYLNFNEQDFEDMRMEYSISKPFHIKVDFFQYDSLYGEKYREYLERKIQ